MELKDDAAPCWKIFSFSATLPEPEHGYSGKIQDPFSTSVPAPTPQKWASNVSQEPSHVKVIGSILVLLPIEETGGFSVLLGQPYRTSWVIQFF